MILDLTLFRTLFIAEKAPSTEALEVAMVISSDASFKKFWHQLSEIGNPSRYFFLAVAIKITGVEIFLEG